ncbi:MAG: hypothetical protein IJF96_03040 [Firmicutes bacterium]|nr:hypothetical protein [Bacillota bacterium]
MNRINDEKERRIIEELTTTNRLLTDLTQAGSWVINYWPDGSLKSVQWGDDFRFCRKDGSVRWYRSKGILSSEACRQDLTHT